MAHIYRGAGSNYTPSQAENDLLRRFEQLPDAFTVVHSVPWVGHRSKPTESTEGEADFLIAHPDYGLLMIEVKGGYISTEREQRGGQWETVWYTQPQGSDRKIALKTDPYQQAERSRRNLIEWLENDRRTRMFSWKDVIYPAAILPDSQVMRDLRPDCPREVFIDISGVDVLEKRLTEVFAYWKKKYPARFAGRAAIDAVIDLLLPCADLTPSLAEAFHREGKEIDRLTEEQFDVLKNLRLQNRAAIVGGAGTGKTVLAMEKTRRLVDSGQRVLFLCFNENLAAWVSKMLGAKDDALIEVLRFHQLVERFIRRAKIARPPTMKDKEFYERAADFLQDALDKIRQSPSAIKTELYDAIVVDEGQDFQDEWWIPLPDLLKDPENGVLYIFFDDNQRLYTQMSNIPFKAQPFVLFKNCRNTQEIFSVLKRYLPASDETECIGPQGRHIELCGTTDKEIALSELKAALNRLSTEDICSEDIVLLTPSAQERSMWKNDQQIGKFVLTWNFETTMQNAIRVCTIYRFKGLESPVIILSEMDKAYEEITGQLAYVGLSRARNHVVVIGKLPEVKKQPSDS